MVFRLFIALIGMCFVGAVQAEIVRLAVAANFANPLKKIVKIFETETGHQVRISIGSSGKIYAQIVQGAPFDVFLSADQTKPIKLIADGLAIDNSLYTYAIGRLVLWTPVAKTYSKTDPKPRIAIANPKTAPYGAAALEAIAKMSQILELKPQLVRGENVAQAYQFVASGAADMGFVALSQMFDQPEQSYQIVPEDQHGPLKQDMVMLKRAIGNPAAADFMRFIQTEKIRDMIETFGYK